MSNNPNSNFADPWYYSGYVSHSPMRPRQGDLNPFRLDNYAKVESRQEMGYKLSTFLGTITGDPHIAINAESESGPIRDRSVVSPNAKNWKKTNQTFRTAHNPYTKEVD
jgi:hypothetical protein